MTSNESAETQWYPVTFRSVGRLVIRYMRLLPGSLCRNQVSRVRAFSQPTHGNETPLIRYIIRKDTDSSFRYMRRSRVAWRNLLQRPIPLRTPHARHSFRNVCLKFPHSVFIVWRMRRWRGNSEVFCLLKWIEEMIGEWDLETCTGN
jgi:hypothetical protein